MILYNMYDNLAFIAFHYHFQALDLDHCYYVYFEKQNRLKDNAMQKNI